MDAIEQNKNTVTEFIDALFTKGDLGAVDDYLAEEFVNHDPPVGVTADREGMRAAGAMFRAAFPDWHSEMDILVGEGDLVLAMPSPFPGSISGASGTAASWSAGDASTNSACCASSGW
jgi:predicted SnoaL-like aldol condensation-catalyzing enzyme